MRNIRKSPPLFIRSSIDEIGRNVKYFGGKRIAVQAGLVYNQDSKSKAGRRPRRRKGMEEQKNEEVRGND